MIIARGSKHNGDAAEMVVLSDPYFVKLTLDYTNPEGDMPEVRQEFLRLIDIFDQKKFMPVCRSCFEPAKILAFFKGTLFNEPWCGECIPYWLKAHEIKMDTFCDYLSALEFVDDYCRREKFFYRMIIRNMARLKGLPEFFGTQEALDFFREEPDAHCPPKERQAQLPAPNIQRQKFNL